jgi:hypothetical protein
MTRMCKSSISRLIGGAGQPGAETDVVQPAVVAHRDRAAGVDLVGPDPVVVGMTGPVGTALGRAA